MLSIFAALERLFSMVEPNQLLFVAIDGKIGRTARSLGCCHVSKISVRCRERE